MICDSWFIIVKRHYLKDVVLFGALFRPISCAQLISIVLEPGEHHDDNTPLLPDHLPEVSHRLTKWSLAHNVGWISWIMVSLEKTQNFCSRYKQTYKRTITYHCAGVDVVRVGGIDQGVQDDPVVIVGKLVRVPVLLLVLGLEGHRGGARLGLVAAQPDPLLLQPLFVLQVVLHVGQDL